MQALLAVAVALAQSAIWPCYLMILSYVARLGPWPRSVARPLAFILAVTAVALFVSNFLRKFFGAKGWASRMFEVPPQVVKQLRRSRNFILITAGLFLLPSQLLSQGLLAPAGQPLYAHTVERLLILSFELCFLWTVFRLIRSRGALAVWFRSSDNPLPRLGRHRRKISGALFFGTALLIALDTQGYGFTARRLSLSLVETFVVVGFCVWLQRFLMVMVDRHAWRWIRTSSPSGALSGGLGTGVVDPSANRDVSYRVRRIIQYAVPLFGLFLVSWVWELDLALFRYVTEQKLWTIPSTDKSAAVAVTVGDLFKSIIIFSVTGILWRNLSTIFAILVYPRMTDDPGVRFAMLTLCRYLVLGIGILFGLSAINLGFDKIGMVLAALGVGLGFGLQEIVSNFVSGLILLLERPLRVGDIVTVANMSGKVDRINIRATTIINADNQSMIIPNREFITGSLVNWTHKDKIVRVTIKVGVAYGSDLDRVSDLLLAIAREDPDVLGNPVPAAVMEEFVPGALMFTLYVFVPDPSVTGRVKHRLSGQIHKKFAAAGIEIPLPKQELKIQASDFETVLMNLAIAPSRHDHAGPHVHASAAGAAAPHIRIDRPPTSLIE